MIQGVVNEKVQRFFRGHYALAKIIGEYDHPVYERKAKILAGPLKDETCVVKGDSGIDEIIARIEFPFASDGFQDPFLTVNAVTELIPDGFQNAEPDDVILYGLWNTNMKGNFEVPLIGQISKYYLLGNAFAILYIGKNNHKDIPLDFLAYDLMHKSKPQLCKHGSSKDHETDVRDAYDAVERYLDSLLYKAQNAPRIVIIDSVAPRSRVFEVLDRTGKIQICLPRVKKKKK